MKVRFSYRLLPLVITALFPTTGFPLDSSTNAVQISTLAEKYGCFSCHGPVHKQVGPGFAQIADRYRQDPTAATTLASRLRTGTVGRWGRLVMPRQAHMTEEESLALARWVLNRP